MTRTTGFGTMLCFLFACAGVARADGFDVRPVTIEAHDGQASFTVSNPGDIKIYMAVTVNEWTQDAGGRDVLRESSTAIASPPGMWVGPRSSYMVRLRFPVPTGERESSYRVSVQNVPDRSQIAAGRVVFAVTQNLPAFSQPANLSPPDLRGSLDGGKLRLTNNGGRRARISGVAQDGRKLAEGLLGYALGGSSLMLDVRPHAGRVEVATDLGMRTLDIR